MKPVMFKGVNVILGKDQPEYVPLPAHRTEDRLMVTSCWELSEEELAIVNRTHRVWFNTTTFGHPIQPQLPMVERPKWLPPDGEGEPAAKVGVFSRVTGLMSRLAKWYVGRKLL